jgi:repressor LexA
MVYPPVEALGPKIRRQRRKLGLTLDELAGRTGISKPYLSLIETGRVANPPSDGKLRKLEQSLGFAAAELIGQAHLQRTPQDVRAMLVKLTAGAAPGNGQSTHPEPNPPSALDAGAAELKGTVQVLTEAITWPEVDDREAFAVRLGDDAMTPKYCQGDMVIFSPAQAACDGDDCFVRLTDGRTAFRRAFFETGDGGQATVRLQPRNERYRPAIVAVERISALHKAVYAYQRIEDR